MSTTYGNGGAANAEPTVSDVPRAPIGETKPATTLHQVVNQPRIVDVAKQTVDANRHHSTASELQEEYNRIILETVDKNEHATTLDIGSEELPDIDTDKIDAPYRDIKPPLKWRDGGAYIIANYGERGREWREVGSGRIIGRSVYLWTEVERNDAIYRHLSEIIVPPGYEYAIGTGLKRRRP